MPDKMSFNNLHDNLSEFRLLDELSGQATVIHRVRPEVKIIIALIYICMVVSFGKYEIRGLMPFFAYQVVMVVLAELPLAALLRRVAPVMVFVFFLGIFNPLFDDGGQGWISFLSLMIKGFLSVSAGLILISTTGVLGIAAGLMRLRIPKIFVLQFIMVYRYIFLMSEEISRLSRAYSLRRGKSSLMKNKRIHLSHIGSFLGSFLIRAFDRSERIYAAMKCRGFDGDCAGLADAVPRFRAADFIFILSWVTIFIIFRFADLPDKLGKLMEVLF